MDTSGLPTRLIGATIALLIVTKIITFIASVWKPRALFQRMQKEGFPMPPHNPIFGHLLAAKEAADELPPQAHNTLVLQRLNAKVPKRDGQDPNGGVDAYYFDPFPINDPLLVVRDPLLANQVSSHPTVGSHKPPVLTHWFAPITGRGGRNLFCSNYGEWKHNNALFLPFFNNSNLDATIPVVVEQFRLYREILRAKARDATNAMFHLEPVNLLLMNDIIGQLLFNVDLGNQKTGNTHPLSKTMLQQLSLKFVQRNLLDNLASLSFFRKFQIWNNGRMLDNHIRAQIDLRLQQFRNKANAGHDDDGHSFKSVLDQALESYFEQRPQSDPKVDLEPEFIEMLCAEMRMFFFAGYDSTASAMVCCIYNIWRHPEVLAKLRHEHDAVFGPSTVNNDCMDRVAQDPNVLNQLPYTLAVIKEALRLYPPAAGLRTGFPDLVLTGRDGQKYPTADMLIQLNHYEIGRNSKSWARATEFLPERFLVSPGHELYPEKGAWRPFEHGVRNCTGQALVIKELKAFLVLIVREFDFQDCYEEVYKDEKIDLTNADGEIGYFVERGAAHMRGHFPCRVRRSDYSSSTAAADGS